MNAGRLAFTPEPAQAKAPTFAAAPLAFRGIPSVPERAPSVHETVSVADPEVTRFGYLCMRVYLDLSERFLLRHLGEHLGDRRRRFCLRGSYFCDRTTCSIVQSTHRPCSPEQVIPAGELETIASTKFDTSG
jgi:hypothetical protein